MQKQSGPAVTTNRLTSPFIDWTYRVAESLSAGCASCIYHCQEAFGFRDCTTLVFRPGPVSDFQVSARAPATSPDISDLSRP